MKTPTLRGALVLATLLVPLSVFAFDLTDRTGDYTDGPFAKPDRAAINLLTNAGIIKGNPDGTFAANRTLNRAEFVTIALRAVHEEGTQSITCFPDVRAEAWFSANVCRAKELGVIAGYPSGRFEPSKAVNYVEAVKILTNLFAYTVPSTPIEPWYQRYMNAAGLRKVLLPPSTMLDTFLSRGEMARLTAAFVAEAEGRLDDYRKAEKVFPVSSSSSSVSSSSSSSSISSTSSSSSSSSSSSTSSVALPDFPSRSRILVAGERSQPIVGGGYLAHQEGLFVKSVRVRFHTEVKSFDTLFLVDQFGKDLAQLTLDIGDNTKRTWLGTVQYGTGGYLIPQEQTRVFGIEARLKPADQGAQSQELVQIDLFQVSLQGKDSGTTYDSPPNDTSVYPSHQTALGTITSVNRVGPAQSLLMQGTDQLLGRFSFTGRSSTPQNQVQIKTITFQIAKSPGVTVTNWYVKNSNGTQKINCTTSGQQVTCSDLSPEIGLASGTAREMNLFASVIIDPGTTGNFVITQINQAGNVSEAGDVRWTDGSADFSWIPLPSPLTPGVKNIQ